MSGQENTDFSMDETITGWKESWEKGDTMWSVKDINPVFLKYKSELVRDKIPAKVLFPLCGDVPDMKVLADEGHHVVGVEVSPIAVEKFFQENHVKFSKKTSIECNGDVYTSEDGRIRIYCCDFYDFNSNVEKNFNAVWDRGSLNAVNYGERKKYVDVIKSLLGNDAVIIVEILETTRDDKNAITADTLRCLFGSGFCVNDLGLEKMYMKELEDMKEFKGFHFYRVLKSE